MELWVHVSRLLVPHLDSDQWKHFILNILLLVGGDATDSFYSHQFYCCMFSHTLDRNCTCQNNPRLGLLACSIFACIFIHQCVHGGVGSFSFSPYTPPSCTCLLISLTISLIIIHHNFHHADSGVGNSTSSSTYTPPSAHAIPSHSSTFTIIFIPLSCVPSYAQSYQHHYSEISWFQFHTVLKTCLP